MFKKIVANVLISLLLVFLTIFIFLLVIDRDPRVLFMRLDSQSYREAVIFWEKEQPLPQERLEVFYRVVDSLTDDIQQEYKIPSNIMEVYYLSKDRYGRFGGVEGSLAFCDGGSIFLSEDLVEENLSDGVFAMVLVHEYVHVVQQANPGYVDQYALDTGWIQQGDSFYQPKEDINFFNGVWDSSLSIPQEDMADTFMFSYLCENALGRLSEERKQHVDRFWGVPREEYCQHFD